MLTSYVHVDILQLEVVPRTGMPTGWTYRRMEHDELNSSHRGSQNLFNYSLKQILKTDSSHTMDEDSNSQSPPDRPVDPARIN